MSPDPDVLRETLAALELPRRGLRHWLAHLSRFCSRHGGARTYPELLALLGQCEAALGERPEDAR